MLPERAPPISGCRYSKAKSRMPFLFSVSSWPISSITQWMIKFCWLPRFFLNTSISTILINVLATKDVPLEPNVVKLIVHGISLLFSFPRTSISNVSLTDNLDVLFLERPSERSRIRSISFLRIWSIPSNARSGANTPG